MRKIAVITPVSHLKGIKELILTKSETVFYCEDWSKDKVRNVLLDFEIDTLICNPNQQTYKIDKELLEGTNVKLINTCSTGMNHIDEEYCKEQGIEIYSLTKDMELINDLPSTSELAFGLMCSLLRKIPQSYTSVWRDKKWDYLPFVGRQMKGMKIGIIGYGRLGKLMANYCDAFGMKTLIYDPYIVAQHYTQAGTLERIFKECDVVSLHVHVNEKTKYMINKDLIGLSEKDLYIINTSRGEIVNEQDITDALENGKLAGYGTDVLEDEFGDLNNSPFRNIEHNNLIITPHIGGMTIEGQTKAYTWAINKFKQINK